MESKLQLVKRLIHGVGQGRSKRLDSMLKVIGPTCLSSSYESSKLLVVLLGVCYDKEAMPRANCQSREI